MNLYLYPPLCYYYKTLTFVLLRLYIAEHTCRHFAGRCLHFIVLAFVLLRVYIAEHFAGHCLHFYCFDICIVAKFMLPNIDIFRVIVYSFIV